MILPVLQMHKRKKKKKSKATRKKKRKNIINAAYHFADKVNEKKIYDIYSTGRIDHYWDVNFEADEINYIVHPNNELNRRNNIERLCRISESTDSIEFLENLYNKAEDVVSRSILVKKIHLLRRAYLQSYKEYSDSELILLTQREKMFDKWEGIYILGCYSGKEAITYLQDLHRKEKNKLLSQTIERAIHKIELNIKKKIRKRDFR